MDILALSSSRNFWGFVRNAPPFTSILKTYFLDNADRKSYRVALFLLPIPIGSMHSMFTYIWLICMINVGKYTMHGSYGICNLFEVFVWRIQFVILGVWRTPFLGPLVKTILVQPSANQNCSPKVWGPSFLVMTHAFVSPLNLAPIFFNSSLKWKVGPMEIVSAERCCSFGFFSIFWLNKGGTSPKNTRKGQWFRYRLTWGATWNTGPFRWELPMRSWKFNFHERFFM